MAKYVFDSNIFMNLQRRQPIDIYPSLWNKLGELMTSGIIISSQEVYDEIAVGGDELEKWAKSRKEYFLPSDVAIQSEVRTILQNYRGLVEGGKKKIKYTTLHRFLLLYKIVCKPRIYVI